MWSNSAKFVDEVLNDPLQWNCIRFTTIELKGRPWLWSSKTKNRESWWWFQSGNTEGIPTYMWSVKIYFKYESLTSLLKTLIFLHSCRTFSCIIPIVGFTASKPPWRARAFLFSVLMGTVTRCFFCNAHGHIFASSIHKHSRRSMLMANGSAYL